MNFAGNVGFGTTVEMVSTATTDEVRAYYQDELGDPTFQDSESVTWSVLGDGGALTSVSITGTDGDVTILVIAAGE